MGAFTAADVKKLREKTGAGMMDAKKALEGANGDIEAAVDALRAACAGPDPPLNAQQRIGLRYYGIDSRRMPRAEAAAIEQVVRAKVLQLQ